MRDNASSQGSLLVPASPTATGATGRRRTAARPSDDLAGGVADVFNEQWHHLSVAQTAELLDTDAEEGLDLFAVKHRRQRHGPNEITPRKGQSAWLRFLLQFHQPLIYILLAAGAVTIYLREWVDAAVIFCVVLLNAVIGYLQESKAVAALKALAQTMTTEATVVRAGERLRVPAAELVPGDLVALQSGDKVPADLRLVHSRDLQIDESALTGESLPVEKDGHAVPRETPLAERRSLAFASSLVTYGAGRGLVVATGDETEVGRISELIAGADQLQTPLTRKLAQLSKLLLIVILGVGVVTFVVGLLRGEEIVDMFEAAIALAVAAVPEGLPAAVTITLAIGVSRMAHRRAIVRKLPAVETLGSTSVICTDKTGTLTENQMTVQSISAGGRLYTVSGTGYEPSGRIGLGGEATALEGTDGAALRECLLAGLLCNDSRVVETDGRWTVQGDPTEGALEVAARKAGLTREAEEARLPRRDTIPFESRYQYMATLHETADGASVVYLKGSAEAVLSRCAYELAGDGAAGSLEKRLVTARTEELAADGLRVLALARGELSEGGTRLRHDDVRHGLTFLGLEAMIDPPRPDAVAAVAACRSAGIAVKMITGDHAVTAGAIAARMGIGADTGAGACVSGDKGCAPPQVLTGRDVETLHDAEFIDAVDSVSVFARVSPEQKLRLVEALQARGNVVAMTGDGVNDAPALKQADIGVAMGLAGTDVAKEAADMVLTDDNFASVEAAVEEGRCVFDNLLKFVTYALPTNLGQGLVLLAAVFAGVTLPILPLQILWINMTTAVFLGLGLAFEPKEAGLMERRPRPPRSPILSRQVNVLIVTVGLILLAGAFALFEVARERGVPLEEARTISVNTFMAVQTFYLFNCRSLTTSAFRINPLSNVMLLVGVAVTAVLQAIFTYVPFMNTAFGSAPLSAAQWVPIILLGLAAFLFIEGVKGVQNFIDRRLAVRRERGAVMP
jgi:cation-transporting P-type ATPase F